MAGTVFTDGWENANAALVVGVEKEEEVDFTGSALEHRKAAAGQLDAAELEQLQQ